MNNYVTLDTKKYAAPHGDYGPKIRRVASERITLSGAVDVTYGPAVVREWIGTINAPVTARTTGWGTITDLRASLLKRQGLAFIDHYGFATTVHSLDDNSEQSFSPMWDGASNEFRISIRLLVDIAGGAIVPVSSLSLGASMPALDVFGERFLEMDTLSLVSDIENLYPGIPIPMATITLLGTPDTLFLKRVIGMDELTLAGSTPVLTVA